MSTCIYERVSAFVDCSAKLPVGRPRMRPFLAGPVLTHSRAASLGRTRLSAFALGGLIFLALAAAGRAQSAAGDFKWRVGAFGLEMTGADDTLVLPREGRRVTQEISGSSGFALSVERRVGDRLGIEVSALFADVEHDVRFGEGAESRERATMGTETFTLGANWYLVERSRYAFGAGALAGIMFNDDVTVFRGRAPEETFRFDDDTGFGAKIFFDYLLSPGGRWGLAAEARWIGLILESEIAGEDLDVDPLMLAVGVTFRF